MKNFLYFLYMPKPGLMIFSRLLAVIVSLSGCGGTGQGQGSASVISTQISGVALDGYLASATCYLDINENFTRDSVEPSAVTDAQGYYSFNPLTNVDYCRADASTDESLSCLQTTLTLENVPLRCVGGYDVVTEEPFNGSVSRLITEIAAGTSVENQVVSPITALIAAAKSDVEQQQIVQALNLSSVDDLNVDYITQGNAELTSLALRIQKVSEVLAEPIAAAGDAPEIDIPGQIIAEISARILAQEVVDINALLSETNSLSQLALAAENRYREQVITVVAAEDRPTSVAVLEAARAQASQRAKQVNDMAVAICTDRDVSGTFENSEINACMRATEVVTQRSITELTAVVPVNDADLDTAVSCFASGACETVLTALENSDFDLTRLKREDFSDVAATASAARLPSDAQSFFSIGGQSLRVNDPDNFIESKRKHARLEFYFEAGETNTSGNLSACIRYIEGVAASSPSTAVEFDLENGNTLGAYLLGQWRVLGSGGYAMLVRMQIAGEGTRYDALVRGLGENTSGYPTFSFDFDGGFENWLSREGVTQVTNQPLDDAGCRDRFNAQIDTFD